MARSTYLLRVGRVIFQVLKCGRGFTASQPAAGCSKPDTDQSATAGVAFSYAFPANTFSDPNAGTTLTYTARWMAVVASRVADLYGKYPYI